MPFIVVLIYVLPRERVHRPKCFLPTPSYKSNIEKHTKETMLSTIGWLFKRAAKNTRDSAAKKEYERGLLV